MAKYKIEAVIEKIIENDDDILVILRGHSKYCFEKKNDNKTENNKVFFNLYEGINPIENIQPIKHDIPLKFEKNKHNFIQNILCSSFVEKKKLTLEIEVDTDLDSELKNNKDFIEPKSISIAYGTN